MIALLDGDIIVYRASASAEDEDVQVALDRCDRLIDFILLETNATSYYSWIGGSTNFRKEIDPTYKAHRPEVKPKHLIACQEHLVKNWNTIITDGNETDDELAIAQSQDNKEDTIICSIDKDLLQVPGNHFNFVRNEFYQISNEEGLKNFYRGLIIGDTADNIKGVKGLGKVKAEKVLSSLEPQHYHLAVLDLYDEDLRFYNNCKLMWLMREPNGVWTLEREQRTYLQGILQNEEWNEADLSSAESSYL